MPEIRNYTLNFGPQHPAAHGVLRLAAVAIAAGRDTAKLGQNKLWPEHLVEDDPHPFDAKPHLATNV